MNRTAYLVAFIDITVSPPIVRGIDIFSEPGPTTNIHRYRTVELWRASDETYGKARARVLCYVGEGAGNEWMQPLLSQRSRQ